MHEFSLPKEDPACWQEVDKRHPFNPSTTLLVDDNLHALESAGKHGIAHLLAIYQPDSRAPSLEIDHFDAIHSFEEILPIEESRDE